MFSEIGDPGTPGSNVSWVSVGNTPIFPDTAFWVAERTTTGTHETPFTIFPIKVKETGLPFVTYSITRAYPGIPAVNSPQWNLDAIEAVENYTGRDYSTVKEFGYSTVVVISYNILGSAAISVALGINLQTGNYTFVPTTGSLDSFPNSGTIAVGDSSNLFVYTSKSLNGFVGANQDLQAYTIGSTITLLGSEATAGVGKVDGIYKRVNGVDRWVGNNPFIDGNLLVDGTIAADKIQANAITATQIAADTITATEIAADTITALQIDVTVALSVQDLGLTGTLVVDSQSGAIGWGKTGPLDFTNTGLFIGNEGGSPYVHIGSPERYFYFDGANNILFLTGETVTGPATVGGGTLYDEGGTTRY